MSAFNWKPHNKNKLVIFSWLFLRQVYYNNYKNTNRTRATVPPSPRVEAVDSMLNQVADWHELCPIASLVIARLWPISIQKGVAMLSLMGFCPILHLWEYPGCWSRLMQSPSSSFRLWNIYIIKNKKSVFSCSVTFRVDSYQNQA